MGGGERGKGAFGTRRHSHSRCGFHGHGVPHHHRHHASSSTTLALANGGAPVHTYTRVRRAEICLALLLLFAGVSCLILGTMFVALYVEIEPMDSVGPIMLVVGAILFVLGTGVCCYVSSDKQVSNRPRYPYYHQHHHHFPRQAYYQNPYRHHYYNYRTRFDSIPRSDLSDLELRTTTSESSQDTRFSGSGRRGRRSLDSGRSVRINVHSPLDQLTETDLDFSDDIEAEADADEASDNEQTLPSANNEPPPSYEEVCGTRV
ncbi:uncharacterized protein [Ptychodera flava]|uniref:uncharacterized protein n=1 Tax=Ptychodera flava TaxID=63121 RepID=UPI003969EF53